MADGSTVSREFKLIEEYREITYEVTGVLKAATGEFAARESLNFYNSADGGSSYDTETGENGEYRIDLPEGSYSVFWNEMYLDSVTVEKRNMVCNLQSEDMFRVSGVVYRQGKIWADAGIHFELEDISVFCRSDKKTGAYSVYLPKNHYIEELTVNGTTVKRDGMPNSIKENTTPLAPSSIMSGKKIKLIIPVTRAVINIIFTIFHEPYFSSSKGPTTKISIIFPIKCSNPE